MIKLMGCIMLVMAGAGFGCCKADNLECKYRTVKNIEHMLNDLYIMLESSVLTKAEITERIMNNKKYHMFEKYILNNSTDEKDRSLLSKDDESKLTEFFEQLGTTDLYGQLSRTKLYIGEFSQREELLKEKLKRCGRLYRGMGVICGAAAAILIM